MDRKAFQRLVTAGFLKSLTLSIAGMVDCAIVGQYLGADGLSAMKLAMPIFYILSLLSSILSTGLSIAVSQDLARGKRENASRTVKSVFTITMALSAAVTLAGIFCPSVFTMILAGNQVGQGIFSVTTDYIVPILIAAFPILLFDVLGTLAMLEGANFHMQCASVVLLVADIIGDFRAVRLKLGMTRIAAASAIAYFLAFIVIASFFLSGRSMFRLRLGIPNMGMLGKVAVLGAPMLVKELCGILWPVSVNYLMLRYGTVSGLAALSIQDAVHYLPSALCSGISGAVLILTGIYAGEQDEEGLKNMNACLLRWSLIGGTAIAALLGLAAWPLLRLFTSDGEILTLSVSALRLYLIGVPFTAINLSAAACLQGFGKKGRASLILFVNHIVLSILSAFLLGRLFGTIGFFASFSICEIITAVLVIPNLLVSFLRRRREEQHGLKEELRRNIQTINEAVSASQEVNTFCLTHRLGSREAFLIALCAEELAVNIIEHGFTDGKKHQLELRAVVSDEAFTLRLRDNCRRFDPVEWYKIVKPDDPSKNIGLRIVFGKANDVNYSSALSINNICVKYLLKGTANVNQENTGLKSPKDLTAPKCKSRT